MKRLLLLALLPALAQAQYLNFKTLASLQKPLPYWVDNRTSVVGGVSVASMKTSVDSAWKTWNDVACAVPKSLSKGMTVGVVTRPGDRYDTFNVTPVWIVSQSDPDYVDTVGSSFTVAITIPIAYAGVLQTCDSFFNAADHTFSVLGTTAATDLDLESVAVHEFGHCLGLDHSNTSQSVMEAAVYPGLQRRQLTQDDVTQLCTRYPLAGAVGAPCLADGGCGSPSGAIKCITQNLGASTERFCTQGCVLNSGTLCDLPLYCQQSTLFSPANNGACLLPGTAVTAVGRSCGSPNDCGSALAKCFTPQPLPSGNPAWADGYCTQSCEVGQAPCPAGSNCTLLDDGTRHCIATCRVGQSDCRQGYACVTVNGSGLCLPQCYTTADCATGYDCRTCDGLCVTVQNPSGQIGDPCTLSGDCGAGQSCLRTDTRQAQLSCTIGCGRGCGTCPTGTTCYPLALGDMYCLRDCNGPGTCAAGMRCGDFANGKACVPACHIGTDCPVGQECRDGECLAPDPTADGGYCGSLCTAVDSGRPVTPIKKDGGTGGELGSAGCGCTSAPSEWAWLALAWAVVVAARRSVRAAP